MSRGLLAAAVLAAAIPLGAGAAPPRGVALTVENDFFAGYDRHYTSGIQLAGLIDREELPGWLRRSPPVAWSNARDVVLAVGQRIYTPTDIEDPNPDPRDRPYGGWLYLLLDSRRDGEGVIDHVTASLGVVGPLSQARQVHVAAHRVFGGRARGWHTQLRNEPTLLLGWERTWPGVASGHLGAARYDVALRAGATVGNVHTYAAGGVTVRYGSRLPDDHPATHVSLGPPRDGYRGPAEDGWYAWGGLEARAVAHNIFLDGNTFRDGPGVDREPLGFDVQLGIAWFREHVRFGFTYVQRGREFRGQDGPDRYAQVSVSLPY